MRSFVQYVRREQKIGDFKRNEELAWDAPVGLGTDRCLTKEFRPRTGDRIYLISSLRGFSLPSLDACIIVDQDRPLNPQRVKALKAAKKLVFASGKGSRWFPMLDASKVLDELRATTGKVLGKRIDSNGRNLTTVQRLQGARSIRCLSTESALVLENWLKKNSQAPVFISYRAKDGARRAAETAGYLARSGIPVWFDEWSISIRLDDLDHENAESQLLENIRTQMLDCRAIIQIITPEFGDSPWTQREMEWASELRKIKVLSKEDVSALKNRVGL